MELFGGAVIGPYALGWIEDPARLSGLTEIGIALLLFIVGLEMEPSRLWALRKQIFGLGVLQVGLCGALLTLVGIGFSIGIWGIWTHEFGTLDGQAYLLNTIWAGLCLIPLAGSVAVGREREQSRVRARVEADLPGALDLAQQLGDQVGTLALPHAASSVAPVVTVSLGVCTKRDSTAGSAAALLREADAQLYIAKSRGRNQASGAELDSG